MNQDQSYSVAVRSGYCCPATVRMFWPSDCYGLMRKQLRHILDPANLTPRELEDILNPWEEVRDPLDAPSYAARVIVSDFLGKTFGILKEKEQGKFGEYLARRLVLEAWEKLEREASHAH